MSATAIQDPVVLAGDRLESPGTLSILAYGVPIQIRVNDPAVVDDLAVHLPPGSKSVEPPNQGRSYTFEVENDRSGKQRRALYVDGALLARRSTTQAILRAFESDVQLHVAEMAPDRVFVHAGVVGYRGRAILLPGRSFAGKSTLVAELVRAGADYYSDEYAVLDSSANVHPYARPIRRRGGSGVTKEPVHAGGECPAGGPLRVGLVVLSQFRAGGRWSPQRLSPGRGLLALLDNTVAARRIPEVALRTLHQVVIQAPIIRSERGEASSVVEPILGLLDAGIRGGTGRGERDGSLPAQDA